MNAGCDACGGNETVVCRIIHHFRCCEQASEHLFGTELVCPKCKRRLIEENLDYDYSGTLIMCATCWSCLA